MKELNSYKIPFRWRTIIYFLDPNDILWIKADGNYTIITINSLKLIRCQRSLKELTSLLAPYNFFRSHNSWLVNLNHVDKVNLDDQEIVFTNKWNDAVMPLLSISASRRLSKIKAVNPEINKGI